MNWWGSSGSCDATQPTAASKPTCGLSNLLKQSIKDSLHQMSRSILCVCPPEGWSDPVAVFMGFMSSNQVGQLLFVFVSAAATWLLLQGLMPLLTQRLLDRPNIRSSHRTPTPRGGGVAFILNTFIAWGYVRSGLTGISLLPLLALPQAFVGLVDDLNDLPVILRFGAQTLTAIGLVIISPLPMKIIAAIPVMLAVVAVINFTNFMDGLDGLVASCMAVAIAAVALRLNTPLPIWALVGGLLGFLPWNWSPARVFMGDVGSTFLGAVFGGLVLQASTWDQAFACLLVASPLLGDAFVTLCRRIWLRQRVFQAHRLHLFQRLHQAGWSQASVATTYLLATMALASALLVESLFWGLLIVFAEILVAFWLDRHVAVAFGASADYSHNNRS